MNQILNQIAEGINEKNRFLKPKQGQNWQKDKQKERFFELKKV